MNKVVFRGAAGEVRWAYHRAAEVGAWTLEGSQLSARLLSSDTFRLSQQPLTFVVPRPQGAWRWPITSLSTDGQSITATLLMEDH